MLCYHASYVTAQFKVEPSEIRISGSYIIVLLFLCNLQCPVTRSLAFFVSLLQQYGACQQVNIPSCVTCSVQAIILISLWRTCAVAANRKSQKGSQLWVLAQLKIQTIIQLVFATRNLTFDHSSVWSCNQQCIWAQLRTDIQQASLIPT